MSLFLAAIDLNSPYVLLIAASVVLILSHFFNMLSSKFNIPSVLMLIGMGILVTIGIKQMGIEFDNQSLMPALELLGIVGLIMIVLEAALDLELTKDKLPLIGKSMLIALCALLGSAFGIAAVLQAFLELDFKIALLYATPLSIISSAIIIPSVANASASTREFMIYESTFSDILGIMMFYFLIDFIQNGGGPATANFGFSFVASVIAAVAASYALIWLFKDMKGHTKLFLLIATLLLLYALGKLMHLSPLLIILVFGLALANHKLFFKMFINEDDEHNSIEKIEKEFHLITLETAFVVRTFFFVIFGMTLKLNSLLNWDVVMISLAIIAVLFAVRFICLRVFLLKNIFPEVLLAPRGLITILLFFAIPVSMQTELFDSGILLFVIIASSLIMTYALISGARKSKVEEALVETATAPVADESKDVASNEIKEETPKDDPNTNTAEEKQ